MRPPPFTALVLLGTIACGAKRAPPPRAAEEAISAKPAGSPASSSSATASSASTSPASSSTASTSPASSSTASTSSSSAPATSGKAAGKGPPSTASTSAKGPPASDPPPDAARPKPGPHLTAAECTKMLDRYVDLVITAPSSPFHGVTGADLADARTQVKTAAASDPVYVELQGSCRNELRKSNYTCAMAATTVAAWQDCAR